MDDSNHVEPDEAGQRIRLLRNLRYSAYKATHRGREPWDDLSRQTAHYANIGTETRCKVCGLSIRGPLGWLNRSIWGIAPLSKHPDLCNVCRVGERILEVTVLFADAHGYTAFSEGRAPDEVAATMNKVFDGCINTLLAHDAIVDKMMGDAVMAVFGAPIVRPDHAQQAIAAAVAIQEKARDIFPADWKGACIRMGVNTGMAFVGRVGSGEVKDYTAVGDTVNVAQRLQTEAQPGEILISQAAYRHVWRQYPNVSPRMLTVKGRQEPVSAFALRIG